MKTNPNEPATAQVITSQYPEWNATRHFGGLTIRELLAAMAMQGLCANTDICTDKEKSIEATIAECAVAQADALIAALNEEKSE